MYDLNNHLIQQDYTVTYVLILKWKVFKIEIIAVCLYYKGLTWSQCNWDKSIMHAITDHEPSLKLDGLFFDFIKKLISM